MKISADKKLFWYLKDNIQLDLSNSSQLDMYVQQAVTCGKSDDIRRLFKIVDLKQLQTCLSRLKHFLPWEVEKFWEDFFAGH